MGSTPQPPGNSNTARSQAPTAEHLVRQFSEIPKCEKIFETSSGSTSRDLGQKKPRIILVRFQTDAASLIQIKKNVKAL